MMMLVVLFLIFYSNFTNSVTMSFIDDFVCVLFVSGIKWSTWRYWRGNIDLRLLFLEELFFKFLIFMMYVLGTINLNLCLNFYLVLH